MRLFPVSTHPGRAVEMLAALGARPGFARLPGGAMVPIPYVTNKRVARVERSVADGALARLVRWFSATVPGANRGPSSAVGCCPLDQRSRGSGIERFEIGERLGMPLA